MKLKIITITGFATGLLFSPMLANPAVDPESREAGPPDQRPDSSQYHRPEAPEQVRLQANELWDLRQKLRESFQTLLADLDPESTVEERHEVFQAWRETNADFLADAQILGEQIREIIAENFQERSTTPERPVRPDRPDDADLEQRRSEFAADAEEIRLARAQLAEQVREPSIDATERRELIEAFRLELRQKMEEQKEIRRQERLNGSDSPAGNRRPGG